MKEEQTGGFTIFAFFLKYLDLERNPDGSFSKPTSTINQNVSINDQCYWN